MLNAHGPRPSARDRWMSLEYAKCRAAAAGADRRGVPTSSVSKSKNLTRWGHNSSEFSAASPSLAARSRCSRAPMSRPRLQGRRVRAACQITFAQLSLWRSGMGARVVKLLRRDREATAMSRLLGLTRFKSASSSAAPARWPRGLLDLRGRGPFGRTASVAKARPQSCGHPPTAAPPRKLDNRNSPQYTPRRSRIARAQRSRSIP